MIIEKPESARFLPVGELSFEADGEFVDVLIDDYYVCEAAKFLIDKGFRQDVSTQAELIAEAVNHFKWGLGSNKYVAIIETMSAYRSRNASKLENSEDALPIRKLTKLNALGPVLI